MHCACLVNMWATSSSGHILHHPKSSQASKLWYFTNLTHWVTDQCRIKIRELRYWYHKSKLQWDKQASQEFVDWRDARPTSNFTKFSWHNSPQKSVWTVCQKDKYKWHLPGEIQWTQIQWPMVEMVFGKLQLIGGSSTQVEIRSAPPRVKAQ